MLRQIFRLWNEDTGFVISAELVLIATIVVLALVVGLSVVRTAITAELVDVANAFGSANQSFHVHGKDGFGSSSFHDEPDGRHEITFLAPHSE